MRTRTLAPGLRRWRKHLVVRDGVGVTPPAIIAHTVFQDPAAISIDIHILYIPSNDLYLISPWYLTNRSPIIAGTMRLHPIPLPRQPRPTAYTPHILGSVSPWAPATSHIFLGLTLHPLGNNGALRVICRHLLSLSERPNDPNTPSSPTLHSSSRLPPPSHPRSRMLPSIPS